MTVVSFSSLRTCNLTHQHIYYEFSRSLLCVCCWSSTRLLRQNQSQRKAASQQLPIQSIHRRQCSHRRGACFLQHVPAQRCLSVTFISPPCSASRSVAAFLPPCIEVYFAFFTHSVFPKLVGPVPFLSVSNQGSSTNLFCGASMFSTRSCSDPSACRHIPATRSVGAPAVVRRPILGVSHSSYVSGGAALPPVVRHHILATLLLGSLPHPRTSFCPCNPLADFSVYFVFRIPRWSFNSLPLQKYK